jgi:cytochrome c
VRYLAFMIREFRSMKPVVLLVASALALAGTAMVPSAGAQQVAGDPVRGKTVYARCAACHDLNTGATRLGPSLKGVVGRTSGTMPNFNYSQAMKDKAVSWNGETLDAFLAAPAKYVPGNRMAFPPLANAQDRADLIAFLEQSAR